MIEIRQDDTIEYSDEHKPEEIQESMPDVKPNMLCLMDEDYTCRKVVPGKSITLRTGTPVIIKTVDAKTKTVTAIDAQHNTWTFTELPHNDFGDIDYWFSPVLANEYEVLVDKQKLTKAKRWDKIAEHDAGQSLWLFMTLMCGMIGIWLKDVISGTWFAYVMLSTLFLFALILIASVIVSWIASERYLPDAMCKFADNYDINLRELQSLMIERPDFATED